MVAALAVQTPPLIGIGHLVRAVRPATAHGRGGRPNDLSVMRASLTWQASARIQVPINPILLLGKKVPHHAASSVLVKVPALDKVLAKCDVTGLCGPRSLLGI
jgi:hypothetical protein